jgi:serine/threonine-protein kinase
MKRNTPLITLLAGAALGVILLVASMLSTPSNTPVSYSAAAASSAAPSSAAALSPAPAVTESSPASPATSSAAPAESSAAPAESSAAPEESPAESSAAVSAPAVAPSPEPTRTTPTRANYAGRVGGGGGSVAVSVHGDKAVAYVCNGSTVEGWMKGKVQNGKLVLTGKNKAHLTASYHAGKVSGDVEAHGTDYSFSVSTVNKPSGLYQATAKVQGKTIKAGWIVLGDGTQIGSLETDADSATPSAVTAPKLDVTTMTAQIGNVVLHAVPVSGVTGTGF